MKQVYYIGIAVVIILIAVGLVLLFTGLRNKNNELAEQPAPEEVAQSEEEEPEEELPPAEQKKTETKSKATKKSTTPAQKPAPEYQVYMKQTQTVTIELPVGTDYSKTCHGSKCEILIY